MKRIVFEHVAGFFVVLALSLAVLAVIHDRRRTAEAEAVRLLQPFLHMTVIDLGDPQQAVVVLESFRTFHPDAREEYEALATALDAYRRDLYSSRLRKRMSDGQGLTFETIGRLLAMFAQFTAVVTLVLFLTYHAARVAAVRQFFHEQQGTMPPLRQLMDLLASDDVRVRPVRAAGRGALLGLQSFGSGAASLLLFSPAYVIAYTFKSVVDGASLLAMIILAIMSNGLLVSATTSFYTFLVHEHRKGYVETAVMKGLEREYALPKEWEGRLLALVFPLKAFPQHVFRHVYMNARHQYLPVIKQHAAFLITGLIIIEMALNIQGHFCYELLQRILGGDADGVVFIGLCIFFLMKATETVVDVWRYREEMRYGRAETV